MVKSGAPIKKNLAAILVIGLMLFGCRPKSNLEIAARTVRETFRLANSDRVQILGLADETDFIKAIKFQINGATLVSRMVRYYRGWQLEDIRDRSGLWVGKAAAAKYDPAEKNAIAQREIITIASALAAYGRFNGQFAFRDVGYLDKGNDVYAALYPNFAIDLPTQDPWGYPYWFLFGKTIKGHFGMTPRQELDFMVFSTGRDGKKDNWIFDPQKTEAGLETVWNPDHDIIFFNGEWIRGTPLPALKNGPPSGRIFPKAILEFSLFQATMKDREARN